MPGPFAPASGDGVGAGDTAGLGAAAAVGGAGGVEVGAGGVLEHATPAIISRPKARYRRSPMLEEVARGLLLDGAVLARHSHRVECGPRRAVRVVYRPPELFLVSRPRRVGESPQSHHADPGRPVRTGVLEGLDDVAGLLILTDGEPGIVWMNRIGCPAELEQPHLAIGVAILDLYGTELLDAPEVEAGVAEVR